MPLTPGSTFERYEIRSLIGRGGMGEVYHAIDTRLNRPVALKVLRTDEQASTTVSDAGGVARLLREARAAAALNHPNSVAIYELGEAEGIAYIAMELVIGAPLRAYVNDASVSLDTKVSWLVDAARALWAAHKAGLVHRDVKPGNIMVSEEGVVKVLDFGLAKPVTVSSPHDFQTMQGQVLGTPRYMAPEQLEGAAPSALADQYAFGLTAYEVLSGVYSGGPLSGTHTPLDQIVPGVSPELARDVSRMMKRRPAERFPTMEAAAQALRACAPSGAREAAPSAPDAHDGARLRGSSDAPTAARTEEEARRALVTLEEPESMSREIPVDVELMSSKGGTLLLATPMRMASGAPPPTSHGRTLPLAGPLVGVQLRPPSSGRQPVSSGAFQPTASGVYSAKPATTGKDDRAALPRKAGGPGWVAVALVGLLAALAGIIAAWMFR